MESEEALGSDIVEKELVEEIRERKRERKKREVP
jgi:hypothetical protein